MWSTFRTDAGHVHCGSGESTPTSYELDAFEKASERHFDHHQQVELGHGGCARAVWEKMAAVVEASGRDR